MTPLRIAIIGGGYTGAAVAIHLSRASRTKLDITIVEPRDELGRGVAYSTTDPDHRINGPTAAHFLYPDEPAHFAAVLRPTRASDPLNEDMDGRAHPMSRLAAEMSVIASGTLEKSDQPFQANLLQSVPGQT